MSAQALSSAVDSGRVEFEWKVERDGFHVEGDGSYVVVAPANLHLKEHYKGQGTVPKPFAEQNDSELLVLGEQTYLKTPLLGDVWVLFQPEDLGPDWMVLQRILMARAPLDFRAVVAKVSSQVSQVGSEKIDGRLYVHLKTEVDSGTLMNAFADAYGSQGQTMIGNRFSGPISFDVWLDATTLLPRRITADGKVPYLGAPTQIELSLDFKDLNDVDDFPDVPKKFKPLADLRP